MKKNSVNNYARQFFEKQLFFLQCRNPSEKANFKIY